MKNKQKYSFTDEVVEPKARKQARVYAGAEWTGSELISSEFGKLEKGKLYPLTEERAIIADGFKPIYK